MTTRQAQGRYLRLADPDWDDPIDASTSVRLGGRWNAPGTHAVLYLSETVGAARANVARLLRAQERLGISFEMLDPDALPALVQVDVPTALALDLTTTTDLAAEGLPDRYPLDHAGHVVDHAACQPIGARAYSDRFAGIRVRSAAPAAGPSDYELAWFPANSEAPAEQVGRSAFAEWFER